MFFPEFHGYLIASAGIVLTRPLSLAERGHAPEALPAGFAGCPSRFRSNPLSYCIKKGSGQSASLQIFKIPESKFLHQDVLVGLVADGVAGVGGSVEE